MESVDLWQFFASLVFVCGLIGLLAIVLRRYRSSGFAFRESAKRKPRLAVVETLSLDTRNQAMILQRDQVQHLLLKTPEGIVVVESGFSAPEKTAPLVHERESHDDEDEEEDLYPRL